MKMNIRTAGFTMLVAFALMTAPLAVAHDHGAKDARDGKATCEMKAEGKMACCKTAEKTPATAATDEAMSCCKMEAGASHEAMSCCKDGKTADAGCCKEGADCCKKDASCCASHAENAGHTEHAKMAHDGAACAMHKDAAKKN